MNGEKIDGIGKVFRFITPALIIVVGTLILANLDNIDDKIVELKTHFTNHLSHHSELEIGYERRITTLETVIEIEHD